MFLVWFSPETSAHVIPVPLHLYCHSTVNSLIDLNYKSFTFSLYKTIMCPMGDWYTRQRLFSIESPVFLCQDQTAQFRPSISQTWKTVRCNIKQQRCLMHCVSNSLLSFNNFILPLFYHLHSLSFYHCIYLCF